MLIFSLSFHIKLPNQANFLYKAHRIREGKCRFCACRLLLRGSRLHRTVSTTESYRTSPAPFTEREKEPLFKWTQQCHGSPWSLYCGQGDAGLRCASLGHVCRPEKGALIYKENLGVMCRRGDQHEASTLFVYCLS